MDKIIKKIQKNYYLELLDMDELDNMTFEETIDYLQMVRDKYEGKYKDISFNWRVNNGGVKDNSEVWCIGKDKISEKSRMRRKGDKK